jgi:hypothetical protein
MCDVYLAYYPRIPQLDICSEYRCGMFEDVQPNEVSAARSDLGAFEPYVPPICEIPAQYALVRAEMELSGFGRVWMGLGVVAVLGVLGAFLMGCMVRRDRKMILGDKSGYVDLKNEEEEKFDFS